MKQMLKHIVFILIFTQSILLLGSCGNDSCPKKTTCTGCIDDSDNVFGKTFFAYRPVNSNTARKMTAVEDKIHLFGKNDFYGVVDAALEYTRTFKSEKIGKYFSFSKDSTSMTYGPECGRFDIFGLYFGTTASGTVCFNPRIENFIADIDLFMGWNQFICGLWTRLDIVFNHTKWDLRLSDNGDAKATQDLPYSNLKEAWVGDQIFVSRGTQVDKLQSGIINGRKSKTEVAAITFDLGYDFVLNERGHLSASIHAVAPTGTRPQGTFLFEPISGANHSWQLGATVNAAYKLWQNCDGQKSFDLYFDSEITHLFKSTQHRLLGLKDQGAGSSWLLLIKTDEFGGPVGVERAANILNTQLKAGSDIMFDASLMLQYNCNCFFAGAGYNFWLKTKEKAKDIKPSFNDNSFRNINFPVGDCRPCCTDPLCTNRIDALNADVCAQEGGFFSPSSDPSCISLNPGVPTIGTCVQVTEFDILDIKNLDVCPALTPRSMTHKIFANIGYNWKNCNLMPFISLFGEVEFANGNTATDQWGIGLKAGLAF